jgi:UDP-2-acetamido-3-amino-2,3-dideoxy-glucuronate N-acetyltransferase
MSARDLLLNDPPLAELLHRLSGRAASVDTQARVEHGAVLGEDCQVRSGAVLARGTRLGARVVVGPNAVFLDAEKGEGPCVVGADARIGANAVVYAGLRIGARAVVRPGAVLMQDLPDDAVAEAQPALVVHLSTFSHDESGYGSEMPGDGR